MSDAWAIAAGWLALILLFSGPGRIPESADRVNIQFGRKSELLLLKFHIVNVAYPRPCMPQAYTTHTSLLIPH